MSDHELEPDVTAGEEEEEQEGSLDENDDLAGSDDYDSEDEDGN